MDALIFNTLQRVQAEADATRRAELMAETRDELGQHFLRNPQDMEELAYDLLNNAFSDVQTGDLTRQLVEVKDVGLGDIDYLEEDLRGMRAYFQGKGGQIRSDILRYERSQMPREEMVTAIDMHQDEFLLNFWGVLSKLQDQAREKMRTLPTQQLIYLLQHAAYVGPRQGTFAASTLSSDQVDPILEAVADRSDGEVTIVGTRIAVRKFANIGLTYGQNITEQVFRTGVIGVYKGYPVAQIENFEDFDGQRALPDDELWIIGKKVGRVTYYGASAKVQQLRLPSFYFRWESARDVGISIHGVAKGRAGRIVLT